MKFRFYYGTKPQFDHMDAMNYEHKGFLGHSIMMTRNGKPVILAYNSELDIWSILHDFTTVYFGSYNEALRYCSGRFYTTEGKEV